MKKLVCLSGLAVLCAALLSCAWAETVFGSWVYTLNDEGRAVVVRYSGSEREVELPWNLQGHLVTEIGPEAFAGNTAMESITLPVGVTVIRENAFRDCTSLKKVVLPERLETIEDGAFWGCAALKEAEIPDSVAELGENCFDFATRLIGSENSLAGAYAVSQGLGYEEKIEQAQQQKDLEKDYQYTIRGGEAVITSYLGTDAEVLIPAQLGGYPVRVIAENSFSSRYEPEKIVVPEGVRELERTAFRFCTSLREIQLPSTLRTIGDNAFYRCEALEEIVIPEGVTSLGNKAFRGCISLRKVTLPASLKTIPHYAFFECHDRLVLYGPKGSAAEIFAGRNGYAFVYTNR